MNLQSSNLSTAQSFSCVQCFLCDKDAQGWNAALGGRGGGLQPNHNAR